MTSNLPKLEIYTDGACSPNPGPGGWGAILIAVDQDRKRKEISGGEPNTTNNRMELFAAVAALEALKRPCRIELWTDSQYLARAFNDRWIDRWQRNGWRTSSKKDVANADLWQRLLAAAEPHEVKYRWLRGHNDHPENERADQLAVIARQRIAR